jgi:hypothetical protein
MANYQAIVRLRPEVRDFIRNRRWIHRGDVVTYGPNIRCPSFSTDPSGYRHSVFGGAQMGLRDCIDHGRYGLVLGPSSVYGFGLAGNEHTMPSLLAERFGFPFANIGLPEGNSRNLYSILVAIIARAPRPPAAVVHISGGDYTNFCYTSIADAVFGSPNLKQLRESIKERGGAPDAATQMPALLAFTSLWIRSIGMLCKARRIPLVLVDDTTFFEKAEPSDLDRQAGLGVPANAAQTRQFAVHRQHMVAYHSRRKEVAASLDVPLAGPGPINHLGYVDEFHYDRDGTRSLTDDFARALEPLL